MPENREEGVAARPGERSSPRVVIVGGGFGGLYAAEALKSTPVEITVVDRTNHHVFQPLLYQVATASLAPSDVAYPIRAVLSGQRNTAVILAEVTAVDVDGRKVILQDGWLAYDYLILAPGARHSYFAHPEWEEFAPGLKTLEDALAIRRRVLLAFERAEREIDPERRRALLTFILVGGGPTGVELAGAIAEIACKVMAKDFRHIDPRETRTILVEAGPRILPTFPASISAKADRSLQRLCVEVRTGASVTGISPDVVTIGEERVSAATVLWSAGVQPSPLARSLGVPLDRVGRVIVNLDLTVPGHPEVFVVGDLAACAGPDGKPLPGLAPVALQQGRHAAHNILRALRGRSLAPFRYRDRGTMATIGRAMAVADIRGLRLSGFPAWLVWCFIHILWLIGFRNRFVVLFEWAWAYFSRQRSSRLIVGGARTVTPSASPRARG
ncbi:MAG: NAD(P)/FAD-dependent oxidoreductase [Thermoanaerobaculia bacterium]